MKVVNRNFVTVRDIRQVTSNEEIKTMLGTFKVNALSHRKGIHLF